MKLMYMGEVFSRFRVAIHLVVGAILTASAIAQPLGPVVTIPIAKVAEPYVEIYEDGSRKACGVRLFGEWPAYLNYTNRSSYTIFTPGLQSIPSPQNSVPPGGRFRFYCFFNGIDTPNLNADCPTEIGGGFPDWYVEVRRRGPFAAFQRIEADPAQPGRWNFESRSTDPEGEPVTEFWQFGDGGTASGKSVSHQYTMPGSYTVYLTATDTDTLTNRASTTIVVPAPKPVISLRLLNKHSGNRIEIDEEFTVRVTVSATDDGVGALSQLAFTGPALTIPGLFTVLQTPASTNIGTLQRGERREMDWRLRADQAGQFTLATSGVQGRDATNRVVSGAAASARGQVTALIAAIEQRPSRVVIGGDNNGDGTTNDLDHLVELVVGITNVSRQEVTEVKAVIMDDPIQLTSLAQDLNIWFFPTNVPPGDFGTIAPGTANGIRRTNVYVATDRTYAEASILLQGKVGDAGVQARGEGLVTVGGETLIEARFDIEDRPYIAGQVVRVFGTLKNVSRFKNNRGEVIDEGKTVGVVIYPTIEGNGALGYAFLKGSGGRTPEAPTAFMVAPDEEIEISAIIPTAEVTTNTTVAVTYQVVGYVHGEGPKPRRTRPDEVEVVEKVTEGWSARHEVELAGVPVLTDPWLTCPTELSFGGFVSCRFTEGLGNAGGSMVGLFMLTGAGLKEIGVGSVRMMGWGLWALEQTLDGLEDPAARARLAEELIIDLQALKQVGVESLDGVELAIEGIGPAIERAIIDTGRTIETGDFKQIAGGLARITGENIDVPLEGLIAARAVRKAMLVREGAESAAKQALKEGKERATRQIGSTVDNHAARGELAKLPESDELPTGINVVDEPRVYRDAYGARTEEVKGFLQVAKEEGVILAFRSRSPKAAALLDATPPTHLLKAGGVSIKTVSEIDVKYLNYPARFEAECVLVEPPIPWIEPNNPAFIDAANNYLNRFPELNLGTDASHSLRSEVYQRLKFQMEQYPEQANNFIKYSREGIDVNFHAQKQQIGLGKFLLPNKEAKRAARLEPHHFNDPITGQPRVAYRLLMDDGTGVFKPITGDIDFLAILNPDGTMPSLLKRLRVYKKMVSLGMQHGESFTFFKEALREKFLRCCSPRVNGGDGEKMLAATPYGELLTTQFRDNLSVIAGGPNSALKIGKGEFSFLEGALTEVNTLERTASEALPNAIRHEIVPLVSVSALARMTDELEAEADRTSGKAVRMGPDGQPEVYDPAPEAPPASLRATHRTAALRAAASDPAVDDLLGILDELTVAGWVNEREVPPPGAAGGQWRPATLEEVRGGTAGTGLKLSPYTYITDDLQAGTKVIPVLPDAEVGWPVGKPVFAVGDQVVIDPGGSAEEFATVASVLPLTLSRPLQNLQEAGTMVLFLSGLADPATVPGALPALNNLLVWLRSDAGVSVTNGTNVISWTDQSGNGFAFTAPETGAGPVWEANPSLGVPSVRFESSYLVGNLGRTLSNATIFTLCRFTGGGNSAVVYAFGTRNFSGLMMSLGRRNGDGADHFDGAVNRIADDTIPGSNFRVFSQVYGEGRADRHQLMVDLQTVLDTRTTTGRAYSGMASNVVIGRWVTGGSHLVGDLVEWLVYDRVLSVEERFEVEEYLRQRAGLKPFVTPGSLDLSSSEIFDYDVTTSPKVSWSLGVANRELVQTGSGDPSIALSGYAGTEQVIRTKITPTAGSGALGVAFGFEHRGLFHLFDWRQTSSNHVERGMAPAGMRLRTFHLPSSQEPSGADLWSGSDPDRVTTWRANAVPWVAGREYEVVIRLGENQTTVEVNFGASNLETWIVPELGGISGQFGHYSHSMTGARFGPAVLPGAAPAITGFNRDEANLYSVRWANGLPPFVIESATDLSSGAWYPIAPATPNYSLTFQAYEPGLYLRVRSAGVVLDVAGDAEGVSQTFGNNGNLWRISGTAPTRIEAENFDEGGSGVAYLDSSFGNNGGVYRAEHVDLGAIGDFGGGYAVGWVDAGEWLQYTIRVETPGRYRLRARTARGASGDGIIRFLVDGVNKTGDMVVPSTGNWALYFTIESGPFELAAGTQILRVDLASGSSDLNWFEIVPDFPVVQTTFGNGGNAWSISSNAATRIEAEDFDEGGEGVAYHDLNPQNAFGAYRAEAVDIGTTTDGGGGPTLGVSSGEWLEYTIHVQQAGEYRLRARTAQGASGTRAVRFLFDGADKTGSVVVPPTGNWESYATVESLPFELTAGVQILRADITGGDFNLNWIEIVPFRRTTFGNGGNPWGISSNAATRIEAENFDEGGPGVAYLDASPQNVGGTYRTEAVDIYATAEVGGGHTVGWIDAGEWLEYTIQVETAGQYRLRARTARGTPGNSTLRFLVNGASVTGDMVILDTGNWDGYTTVTSEPFALAAGTHILRADLGGGAFNLNWIEFVPDGSLVQTTFGNGGNPWDISSTAATRIEAENFDDGGPGIAYHDTTVQNLSGANRPEAVDVGVTTDPGGGATVGWIDAGEWLEYTIRVETARQYRLRARTARGTFGNATLRFLVDGVDATGNMVAPSTGSWGTYVTVTSGTFALPAGTHVLRADMVDGGFDLNWIEIEPAE